MALPEQVVEVSICDIILWSWRRKNTIGQRQAGPEGAWWPVGTALRKARV
jgi:hypothetical protein